jgi:hypothetical protein
VRNEASLPEIRLAVGEPGLDIGNVETVLDDLVKRCYYLDVKGTAYWISHRPTLNKIIADRRAALYGPEAEQRIWEKVRSAIRSALPKIPGLEPRYFPDSSDDIPDTPTLSLVVLGPKHSWENASRMKTQPLAERMIREYGGRGRTYKSGLLIVVPENGAALDEHARTLIALESLEDPTEQERLKLEAAQIREIKERKQRSERDLKEQVWRVYRRVLLLGEEDVIKEMDLGILHPSAANSLTELIVSRLRQEGLLEDSISPDFLVRNWPPALTEWSTKAMRDMFFASPKFPRLLNPEVLRNTIAEGVKSGKFGYIGKAYGEYQGEPYISDSTFAAMNVEFSDEVVLLPREQAIALKERLAPPEEPKGEPATIRDLEKKEETREEETKTETAAPLVQVHKRLSWKGELPAPKWTKFYMNVLTHIAKDPSLRIRLEFEVAPEGGITVSKTEEIRAALQELGLDLTGLESEG